MNIHINIAVDTISALSEKQLEGNLFLMDDGIYESIGQGTTDLVTHCVPGQLIYWVIHPVDLQTPVSLKSIEFLSSQQIDISQEDLLQSNTLPICHSYPTTPSQCHHENLDEVAVADEVQQDPDAFVWSGYVPFYLQPGLVYHYRLTVQIGHGGNSVMSIETPGLLRV